MCSGSSQRWLDVGVRRSRVPMAQGTDDANPPVPSQIKQAGLRVRVGHEFGAVGSTWGGPLTAAASPCSVPHVGPQ
eukprot:11492226-Alexandrium_andersonii.AAC.1